MGCGSSSTKHIDEQNAPATVEPTQHNQPAAAVNAADNGPAKVENEQTNAPEESSKEAPASSEPVTTEEQKQEEAPAATTEEQKQEEVPAATEESQQEEPVATDDNAASAASGVPSSANLIDIPLVSLAEKPNFGDSKSLTAKYCTQEVWDQVKDKTTKNGFAFDIVINSAYQNKDSGIGCYAPEPDAYVTFAPFFDKVIEDYHHGFSPSDEHTSCMDPSQVRGANPDPNNEFIISTRIRVGRNLDGIPLAPGISKEQRRDVEKRVTEVLSTFDGELAGKYYPLQGMDEETRQKLVDDHFLFKKGDRFLEAAGANRDWPEGRGIYHSDDKRFLVWVNEEDQLRIISMQMGGDVKEVFTRLCKAVNTLDEKLKFAHSNHLGYLTSCPTNLGTAMRASVHIKIPLVSQQPNFKDWCKEKQLSIRGIHGEHSESAGGVYDISNKRRLGLSDVECVQTMYDGVVALIAWEKALRAEQEGDAAAEEEEEKQEEPAQEEETSEEQTEAQEEEPAAAVEESSEQPAEEESNEEQQEEPAQEEEQTEENIEEQPAEEEQTEENTAEEPAQEEETSEEQTEAQEEEPAAAEEETNEEEPAQEEETSEETPAEENTDEQAEKQEEETEPAAADPVEEENKEEVSGTEEEESAPAEEEESAPAEEDPETAAEEEKENLPGPDAEEAE